MSLTRPFASSTERSKKALLAQMVQTSGDALFSSRGVETVCSFRQYSSFLSAEKRRSRYAFAYWLRLRFRSNFVAAYTKMTSAFTISVARLRMLLRRLTHSSGSLALSFSFKFSFSDSSFTSVSNIACARDSTLAR